MNRPPSPRSIEAAMSVLLSVRSQLLADDPDMAADDALFSNMLEGESGDAFDILARIIRAALAADGMAEEAANRGRATMERAARYKARSERLRGAALAAMDALGMRKLELPDVTVSIGTPRASVVILDETELPAAFMKAGKPSPDKTAIKAALEAGETVPGAALNNISPTITLRTR